MAGAAAAPYGVLYGVLYGDGVPCATSDEPAVNCQTSRLPTTTIASTTTTKAISRTFAPCGAPAPSLRTVS